MKPSSVKYSLADIGCYVDGARGRYMIDAIAGIAASHGFDHLPETGPVSGYEFANEVEDEIDSYMNKNYGVKGASWGRSEQGDWGLWKVETP